MVLLYSSSFVFHVLELYSLNILVLCVVFKFLLLISGLRFVIVFVGLSTFVVLCLVLEVFCLRWCVNGLRFYLDKFVG